MRNKKSEKVYTHSVTVTNFDEKTTKELNTIIEKFKNDFLTPSLQISIRTKEEELNISTGFASIEENEKSTLETCYYIASLTKLYTHALILKLVQDEILSFDDPVIKYIDMHPEAQNTTIKDLIYHKSGVFEHLTNQKLLFQILYLGKKLLPIEILKIVKENPPYFKPGSEYRYSNTGYILLGIIAEKATKKSYSFLLNDCFFKYFDVSNTKYPYTDGYPLSLATGYDKQIYRLGKIGLMANVNYFPVFLPTTNFTSGGLIANSTDVIKFVQQLFTTDILNESSKRKLRLFFYTLKHSEETLRVCKGNIAGYNSYIGYSHSKQYYIVFLSNLSNVALEELMDSIIKILINRGKI